MDPLDVLSIAPTVLGEEIAVNGVPCFEYESMVIPGDAVSRNTVPGKKGPTYYPAARIRAFVEENNRIIAERDASGQTPITVYPRHAAALLDAALPAGKVTSYFTRPSTTRSGIEDAWYRAAIPLGTSDGRDIREKMKMGLVKYSSLRTFEAPAFETKPISLNGRVVEEVMRLPIAGIDLVATQPGLPVAPIRLLEETPTLEEWRDPDAQPPPTPPVADPPSTTVPPSPAPPAHEENETHMKHKCSKCGADVADVVDAATHTAVTEELGTTKALLTEKINQIRALEGELVAARATPPAAAAAAGTTEEVAQLRALYEEEKAHRVALTEEMAGLADVKAFMISQQAKAAVSAKLDEVVASDATNKALAEWVKPLVAKALEEQNVTDPAAVAALYWQMRAEKQGEFFTASRLRPAGRGVINIGRSAAEEANGQPATPPAPGGAGTPAGGERRVEVSAAQGEAINVMARILR